MVIDQQGRLWPPAALHDFGIERIGANQGYRVFAYVTRRVEIQRADEYLPENYVNEVVHQEERVVIAEIEEANHAFNAMVDAQRANRLTDGSSLDFSID